MVCNAKTSISTLWGAWLSLLDTNQYYEEMTIYVNIFNLFKAIYFGGDTGTWFSPKVPWVSAV